MSSKEDLLRTLSVKKLRDLAHENRVLFVYETWLMGKQKATTKDEIIDVLNESRKVSKKKVEEKVFGAKKKTSSKESSSGTKPKRASAHFVILEERLVRRDLR